MQHQAFDISMEDLHSEKLAKSTELWLVGIFAVAALLVEGISLYYLLKESLTLVHFLLIHALMVAVLWFYTRNQQQEGEDTRFPMLLTLTTALLGPFGAAGSLLTMLLHNIYARQALSFLDWFRTIFPSRLRTLPIEIEEGLATGRDMSDRKYNVLPFMDVITHGTEAQKREAISKMGDRFYPGFAPALLQALSDPSNAIRVQAATVIGRVENDFLERSYVLEREAGKEDATAEDILALAKHYDDYAFTGLLDIQRERENRKKALSGYKRYLKLHPEDQAVRKSIGRLYLRMDKKRKAAEWFKDIIERGHATPQIEIWYMEALYRTGQYNALREFITSRNFAEEIEEDSLYQAIAPSIRLWQGKEAA